MDVRTIAAGFFFTVAAGAAIALAVYSGLHPQPVIFDLKPGARYAVAPSKVAQHIRAEAFGLNPHPSLYDLGFVQRRAGPSYTGTWWREGTNAVFEVCAMHLLGSDDCRRIAVIQDRFYDDVCAGYVDAKTFRVWPKVRDFAAQAAAHCNNPSPCGDASMPRSEGQCWAYEHNGGWTG